MKIILYHSNSTILSTATYARLDNVRRLVGFCYLLSNRPENRAETQQRLEGLLESFAEKQAILLVPENLKEFFLDWLQRNNKINSLKIKDYEEKELEGEANTQAVKNEILAYVEADDKMAVQIEFTESLSLATTSSKQPAWVNLLISRLLSPCGEEIELKEGITVGDNYRLATLLEEEEGEGDLGISWKATDLERFAAGERNCEVVIKFLPKQFFQTRPDTLKILAREFEQYKRIDHPHIAKTLEINCVGSQIYLVMGFLPGIPLSAFIKQHPNGISLPEAEGMIQGISEAVTHLHHKGVKRLDLKPVNIFYDSLQQSIKLVDFGLNRTIKRVEGAPEAVRKDPYACLETLGEEEPADNDDVYALACIVYELLSGQHPFERKTVEEAIQEGFSLKTLNQLEFYKSQAISDGLAFKRNDRIKTVDEFLVRFFSSQMEMDCPANLRQLYTIVTELLAPLPIPLRMALIGVPILLWIVMGQTQRSSEKFANEANEAWNKGLYEEAGEKAGKSFLAKDIVVAAKELKEAKALDDANKNNQTQAPAPLPAPPEYLNPAREALHKTDWTIVDVRVAVELLKQELNRNRDNSDAKTLLSEAIGKVLSIRDLRTKRDTLQIPILPGETTLMDYATHVQCQQITSRGIVLSPPQRCGGSE